MTQGSDHDAWSAGNSYEQYMGRWSREIARRFVEWLDQPPGLDWLDIGCGTGALSATILERCAPASVLGLDASEGFVAHARGANPDARARFEVADAAALPRDDHSVDILASALAYNFFPDRPAALAEMKRVARPGGTIALYVWDYPGGGLGFLRAFWTAATATNPAASALREDIRFPFCTPDTLRTEFSAAGLADVDVRPIEVASRFESFEDFWTPFTLGAGPAPGYYLSLDEPARQTLKHRLQSDLAGRQPIEFPARAWAVRGRSL